MRHLAAFLALALLSGTAVAGGVGNSAGVGADFERINRYLDIAGAETIPLRGRGNFAGVHAHFQRGAGLRLDGRVLLGSVDYGGNTTENASLIEGRATFGVAVQDGDRIYAGIGLESLRGDSPFDAGGDIHLSSLYVPVGWSSPRGVANGWRPVVNLELRAYVTGRDEIDDIPDIGDETFDRRGGAGVAFSVRFQSTDAPLEVEPYLYWSEFSSSTTERVDGENVRTEDGSRGGAGLRVKWLF